jgi:choline dehydrogenase-like flavoprotein
VVVGGGAAGSWAAKELCEAGLDVLLLEAGGEPATGAGGERRLAARARGLLTGQPVQIRCAAYSARTRRFFVSDRENPYTTPPGRPFNWFRGRQLGGRLQVWARVVPRLGPDDLRDWPLHHDDLAPWYDRVEALLGRQEVALTPAESRFRSAVESAFADRRVLPPPLVRPDADPLPPALRAAHATGRLTLRTGAVVRGLLGDGEARGVAYVDRRTRQPAEARARAVVLCASTIETLRILLASVPASDRLGRGLMDHVLTGIGGPVTDPVADDAGSLAGFQMPDWGGGFAVQGAVGRGTPAWYLLAHGEMRPHPENRVTLDPGRTDAWGVPVAHVSCAHQGPEGDLAARQLAALDELAGAAGLRVRTPPSGGPLAALAFRLWRRRLLTPAGAFVPGSAAHEIGGAPMGSDPATSVTDPFGRLWEVPKVVVADGAAFPAGCWQNVTLTIIALAARAARRLAQDLGATGPSSAR